MPTQGPSLVRVLVVDDDPGVRMTLAANLELEGFVVSEADSARSARQLCDSDPPDVVLTDVQMAEANGVDLFEELHARNPRLPVILMTAFAHEALIDEALRRGVYTVLYKPFEIHHVAFALRRAVNARVLVVDDVAEDAESTVEALRMVGVAADAAHGGQHALDRLTEGNVDVCVVDLRMPEMDGPAVMQRIHAIRPDITCIAVSGYNEPELMRRLTASGAFMSLRKPFAPGDLLQAIAKARGRPTVGR